VLAVDRSGGHVPLAAAQRSGRSKPAYCISLTRARRPGAPLAIGCAATSSTRAGWMPARNGLPSRFFSLRSHERAREMLARHGVSTTS